MPVYITATIGATVHQLSTESLAESNWWDAAVESVSNLNLALSHEHGGYYKPSFGDIGFLPTPFADATPPPQKIDITVETGPDDAHRSLICNGTGTLKNYDQTSVVYSVAGQQFDASDDSNVFTGTLVDAFVWACDASRLNLTLDTTLARSPSPPIDYSNDSEALIIDLLADAAAFLCHGFYIENGTLYLVDLLAGDTTLAITEFDFTPLDYQGGGSISLVKSGDYSVPGSDAAGSEFSVTPAWHTVQANIEAALTDIKTIIEKALFTVELADVEAAVEFNTEVTALDESLIQSVTSVFNVHKKNLSFSAATETLIIEGRGAAA